MLCVWPEKRKGKTSGKAAVSTVMCEGLWEVGSYCARHHYVTFQQVT